MKNFLTLFYTHTAKIFFVLILLFSTYMLGECQAHYFNLYKEDKESFNNAILQVDAFNYETSYYFKNNVKETIRQVIVLATKYDSVFDATKTPEECLAYYKSIGDTSFGEIYERFSNMKGLTFAFVNHDSKKIHSNVPEINALEYPSDIRRYFGDSDNTLLIVRDCRSPYFATSTFISYAEYIRDCAIDADTDFDIYIRFADAETHMQNEETAKQQHFEMRSTIEKLNNTTAVFLAVALLITIVILITTGKNEPGGKTYPTIINRLPNDLLVIIYTIVLSCVASLFRTTVFMLVQHGTELDEFWFTHSEEFYTTRAKLCIGIFICTAVNLLCIIKRQYKMGTLIKNTYIYPYLCNLKKLTSKNKIASDGDNE